MGTKTEKTKLIDSFKNRESFTVNDLYSFYAQREKDIKRTTVNWRISELANHGVIRRTGRGRYALGEGQCYTMPIHKMQKAISTAITKNFPLISFCTWDSEILKEFYQHMAKGSFLIIEVEKDAVDPVYHLVKETHRETFKEPAAAIMRDYVADIKNAIIIKSMITESPLQKEKEISVPSLEKILVDLVADKDLFYFLQGSELIHVFQNAFEKYTINSDRLLRYARRRNKGNDVLKFMEQYHSK